MNVVIFMILGTGVYAYDFTGQHSRKWVKHSQIPARWKVVVTSLARAPSHTLAPSHPFRTPPFRTPPPFR